LAGILLLLIALVYTGSRTGILLLAVMVLILLTQRALIGSRGSLMLLAHSVCRGWSGFLKKPAGYRSRPQSNVKSILLGSDTVVSL